MKRFKIPSEKINKIRRIFIRITAGIAMINGNRNMQPMEQAIARVEGGKLYEHLSKLNKNTKSLFLSWFNSLSAIFPLTPKKMHQIWKWKYACHKHSKFIGIYFIMAFLEWHKNSYYCFKCWQFVIVNRN